MPKGFWQLPLHPNSQEIMSFITTDTVSTPDRVPQGASDSATHFQSSEMQNCFTAILYVHLLVWIDDILV
ncbi:Retrovirus-related Pol Polyprotein from transposon 311 [Phytophthora megakarya]|uniref:Retrovirus-related Pol Polyprotein from transposon 311 n=1 Tax=Phytophthora megakarya TaxID=4795 RepID=A0A225WG03_9STRA|nr:Retrovirus-related Pol Polyprotein from transposon 311 [Phytophthora megakarya]